LIHIDHICGTDDDDLEQVFKELRQKFAELKKDQKQLEADREKFNNEKELNQTIYESDVIHLNVGGEMIATTRQTLISLKKSLFSILFNGRWEQRLHHDVHENILLDFNPIIFRHLLDQLQLNEGKNISPPSDLSLIRSFKKMMKKLRVEHLLSTSDRNILTANVDGQLITTQLSNPLKLTNKTHAFIDYHPKIFRHFIKANRQNKSLSLRKQMFYVSTGFSSRNLFYFFFDFFVLLDTNLNQQIIQIRINQSFTKNFDESRKFNRSFDFCFLFLGFKEFFSLQVQRILRFVQFNSDLKWKQNGQTIAGGNGKGDQLNQLNSPYGIYVDDKKQCIYIADCRNHRIVKWKLGESEGQIVAGGNGYGNSIDQLNSPTDVIVDENNSSLIICDYGNRRVVRWSLENPNDEKEILIENIQCDGLMMNENGDLFVCDHENHAVKRWRKDEIGKGEKGIIVAGGNGFGNKLNQLNSPTFIFIDREETVYVSDWRNHRVMKWLKDASDGIIVAGGQGNGSSLNQLNYPYGLLVNEVGDIYVADSWNNRIMCWPLGSKEGRVVVGGNGRGEGSNQLNNPIGLSFGVENNFYVADYRNHRIQRFDVD